jgi:hypothetical protein
MPDVFASLKVLVLLDAGVAGPNCYGGEER